MLIVVAPAATAASTTSARNSSSVRDASSGENSTSAHSERACLTPSAAAWMISSHAMLSLYWRWIALVARKRCKRGRRASRIADQARSMSSALQRARPAITGPSISRAMECTDSQSPREAAGKPASMMSTPRSASARATRSFSGGVIVQPGDCSPSRSVVSNINTRFGSCSGMTTTRFVEPGHPLAESHADLLDRMREVLLEKPGVLATPGPVLAYPLARERALLHLAQDLLHLPLGPGVDDPRTARQIAELRGLRDEAMHLRDPALVQQVDDQLKLVQTLVVGNLRLVAGLDERFIALYHQLGGTAAEHGLFAEQIGFRFLGKGGLYHGCAGPADAVGVRESPRMRSARRVLADGDQAGNPASLLELASHEVARSLRRDQDDVEVLAGTDLLEVHVEAVCKEEGGAAFERAADLLVYLRLREVGREQCYQCGALDRLCGLRDREAILARLLPALAGAAGSHDHVMTRVLEVECVCPALASVAQDCDSRSPQRLPVHILLRIGTHRYSPGQSGFQRSKTQEPRLGLRAGAGFAIRAARSRRQPTPHLPIGRSRAGSRSSRTGSRSAATGGRAVPRNSIAVLSAHCLAPSVDSSTARGRLSTAVQKETRGERPSIRPSKRPLRDPLSCRIKLFESMGLRHVHRS